MITHALECGINTGKELSGLRILVVDDSPEIIMVLNILLESSGANIDTAYNGLAALRRVENVNYDAVLMDVQMPVMDGVEATTSIRSSGYSLPIIALTASYLDKENRILLNQGFNEYIMKPVGRNLLISKILQSIANCRAISRQKNP